MKQYFDKHLKQLALYEALDESKESIMTPQHRVEKLNLSFESSMGENFLKQGISIESAKVNKRIILSCNFQIPLEVAYEKAPEPLGYIAYKEAMDALKMRTIAFLEFFNRKSKGFTTVHPFLGPLNFNEWCKLHNNNFNYHIDRLKN